MEALLALHAVRKDEASTVKLLTAAIIKKLEKAPLYSQEKNPRPAVIVKFFAPWSSWTWYATEGSKTEDGDWRFFGMVDGHEKELGYFLLSELESVRGRFGLKIERDMYFDNKFINIETMEVQS
jgi:Protein of unknown function (DUF2958)